MNDFNMSCHRRFAEEYFVAILTRKLNFEVNLSLMFGEQTFSRKFDFAFLAFKFWRLGMHSYLVSVEVFGARNGFLANIARLHLKIKKIIF
jgi:hypothetical protein